MPSDEEWQERVRALVRRLRGRRDMNERTGKAPGQNMGVAMACQARYEAYETALLDVELIFGKK
jgi:hypothetical protein